jgi:hypothetical protein
MPVQLGPADAVEENIANLDTGDSGPFISLDEDSETGYGSDGYDGYDSDGRLRTLSSSIDPTLRRTPREPQTFLELRDEEDRLLPHDAIRQLLSPASASSPGGAQGPTASGAGGPSSASGGEVEACLAHVQGQLFFKPRHPCVALDEVAVLCPTTLQVTRPHLSITAQFNKPRGA